MSQQLQEQPWPDKTIKQAITDNEKTIYLQFIATRIYPDSWKHDPKMADICKKDTTPYTAHIGFFIEDEVNETGLDGCFDFEVDSHFIKTTLNCNEETTLAEVCKKAIRHIFAHNVELKKWKFNLETSYCREDRDNLELVPIQTDYTIEWLIHEKKPLWGRIGKQEIKHVAQIQFTHKGGLFVGDQRIDW